MPLEHIGRKLFEHADRADVHNILQSAIQFSLSSDDPEKHKRIGKLTELQIEIGRDISMNHLVANASSLEEKAELFHATSQTVPGSHPQFVGAFEQIDPNDRPTILRGLPSNQVVELVETMATRRTNLPHNERADLITSAIVARGDQKSGMDVKRLYEKIYSGSDVETQRQARDHATNALEDNGLPFDPYDIGGTMLVGTGPVIDPSSGRVIEEPPSIRDLLRGKKKKVKNENDQVIERDLEPKDEVDILNAMMEQLKKAQQDLLKRIKKLQANKQEVEKSGISLEEIGVERDEEEDSNFETIKHNTQSVSLVKEAIATRRGEKALNKDDFHFEKLPPLKEHLTNPEVLKELPRKDLEEVILKDISDGHAKQKVEGYVAEKFTVPQLRDEITNLRSGFDREKSGNMGLELKKIAIGARVPNVTQHPDQVEAQKQAELEFKDKVVEIADILRGVPVTRRVFALQKMTDNPAVIKSVLDELGESSDDESIKVFNRELTEEEVNVLGFADFLSSQVELDLIEAGG